MNRTFQIFTVAFVMILSISMTPVKSTRIIFFGDSITEAGIQPNGYISVIKDKIAKLGFADQYDLIGAGVGGNKIYDLYLRMDDDVLSKNPDMVVIYIGVNDVWHKSSFGTGTDANKFEKFYTAIIQKLQAKNIKVVLCTPACIGERTDFSNQQDGDLNYYSQIIRNLSVKFGCPLCDLRKSFLEYNKANNPDNKELGILTTDRVHLNDKGNEMVADLLLTILLQVNK